MKNRILGTVIAAAALVFSVGAQAQDAIKFGVAAEPYPPFSSKNAAGVWEGFEIDLMNAVCEERLTGISISCDGRSNGRTADVKACFGVCATRVTGTGSGSV